MNHAYLQICLMKIEPSCNSNSKPQITLIISLIFSNLFKYLSNISSMNSNNAPKYFLNGLTFTFRVGLFSKILRHVKIYLMKD